MNARAVCVALCSESNLSKNHRGKKKLVLKAAATTYTSNKLSIPLARPAFPIFILLLARSLFHKTSLARDEIDRLSVEFFSLRDEHSSRTKRTLESNEIFLFF